MNLPKVNNLQEALYLSLLVALRRETKGQALLAAKSETRFSGKNLVS